MDLLTIEEYYGSLAGLKVVIIGDILHSRVARSNLSGLTTMGGAQVKLCGPATFIPPGGVEEKAEITYDLKEAIQDADVIMVLRLQLERQRAGFSITAGI